MLFMHDDFVSIEKLWGSSVGDTILPAGHVNPRGPGVIGGNYYPSADRVTRDPTNIVFP